MSFDLACAAVAVLFAVLGLIRGLVRQVFGIAGFVGGLLLARFFSGPLAERFHAQLGVSAAVAAVLFSFVLFFAAALTAKLLGATVHRLFGLTPITGALNRLGGMALGLCKGAILIWAVASLAALLQPHLKAYAKPGGWAAALDLDHSQAVALAKDNSALGAKARELRARAEAEIKRAHAGRSR